MSDLRDPGDCWWLERSKSSTSASAMTSCVPVARRAQPGPGQARINLRRLRAERSIVASRTTPQGSTSRRIAPHKGCAFPHIVGRKLTHVKRQHLAPLHQPSASHPRLRRAPPPTLARLLPPPVGPHSTSLSLPIQAKTYTCVHEQQPAPSPSLIASIVSPPLRLTSSRAGCSP